MADNTAVYMGTGRRKEAVARVRLIPGTGKITVNGRDAKDYFGRQQLVDNAIAPLVLTETADRFDVFALASIVPSSRRPATSPVTPCRRAQEVRPEEGS